MGAPKRRIIITPEFREEADGTWTGWYPEYGWSVNAATQEACLEKLKAELQEYKSNPGYRSWMQKMMADPPASWIFDDEGAEEAYDDALKKLQE